MQSEALPTQNLSELGTASRPLAFDAPGHGPTSRDGQWKSLVPSAAGDDAVTSADTLANVVTLHTGLVYSSIMMLHAHPTMSTKPTDQHPEGPERIAKAFQVLKDNGCVKRMKRIQPREVLKDEVALIHDLGIWEGVYRSQFYTRDALLQVTNLFGESSSLYINEHTFRSARLSCGGVIELCDAVCSGRIRNGFAIVRPPGHHAEPDRSMGFCMFNNVAVAAKWIREKYGGEEVPPKQRVRKILILDWDVHHGNGTQRAFEEDADILYISLHRYDNGEFYPGTTYGRSASLGSGPGKGYSINIPWPTGGMGDGEYLYAFHQIVMPIAAEFGPDLVIISAGFDAAKGDPLGGCLVTPTGYAQMTYMLMSLAEGKLVVALEGGYNVDALANSALAVTRTILGDPVPSHDSLPSAAASAVNAVRLVKRDASPYWKCVEASPLDPVPADDDGLPKYTISELLKAHRQYELGKRFDLAELPLIGSLSETWGAHALCSPDLLERTPPHETVVLFVHDMGNLRAGNERPDLALVPSTEGSYLVDSSAMVMEWIHKRGFAVVDVNLFSSSVSVTSHTASYGRGGYKAFAGGSTALDFLQFVWDNYLDLSDSPSILLLSHGSASKSLVSLIVSRRLDQDKRINGACLTLGHEELPMLPKDIDPSVRKWYLRNARVFLPETHSWWAMDEEDRKRKKRAGKVIRVSERRAIQVLRSAFNDIVTFLEGRLALAEGKRSEVKAESVNENALGADTIASGSTGASFDVDMVRGETPRAVNVAVANRAVPVSGVADQATVSDVTGGGAPSATSSAETSTAETAAVKETSQPPQIHTLSEMQANGAGDVQNTSPDADMAEADGAKPTSSSTSEIITVD